MEPQNSDVKTGRDAYVEKLKAQLDVWNAQIDKWEAKARKAQADVRLETSERVGEARRRWKALQQKLQELQKEGDRAWDELKVGAEQAREDLRKSIERARSHFD